MNEMMTAAAYCIVGRNGSGKTLYVDCMRKRLASDRVRYVAFSDAYGASTDKAYYLQLRWNQHDIDQETPMVGELLERTFLLTGDDNPQRRRWQTHLYDLFQLDKLLDKYVILLSSGELRKLQLAKTLLANPAILILDNPFIGLDAQARELLRDLLESLVREQRITIYLILAKSDDIPMFIDNIIEIDEHGNPLPIMTRQEYLAAHGPVRRPVLSEERRRAIVSLPEHQGLYHADTVIEMHHVSISYGNRTILKNLDWTVRNGERWALAGQNGSGKSTLLSLVCADNPQSYACDIALFGHQRGTGETIWEIKRHIGYVSPEMHRSYQRAIPAVNVVASGLKDTVGLYVRPNEREKEQCRWWMNIFGIGHLADRTFTSLSSGEQRLALLARAFVKDPELLILDEPLHGLDLHNRQLARDVINAFCKRPGKTLIMVTHYEEELPECITHRKYLEKHC